MTAFPHLARRQSTEGKRRSVGGRSPILIAILASCLTFIPQAEASGVIVRSSSGVVVRVSPSARAALQCVVDYVEAAGVKIKFMRGYGPGTVKGSLHPGGRAIDINQLSRNVTRPHVPRSVANAAADACGVISGARWSYADNGHWNLGKHREPWPRVIADNSQQAWTE